MIFRKTACGPTLHSRQEHGVTFACGSGLCGFDMIISFLLSGTKNPALPSGMLDAGYMCGFVFMVSLLCVGCPN